MKTLIVLLLLAGGIVAKSAPFQNLGFDEANTNNIVDLVGGGRGFYGPADELLPGWKLFDEHGEAMSIRYNDHAWGPILYDRTYQDISLPPLEGKYALGLWPVPGLEVTRYNPYHLSQIGEVPPDAKTIHFVSFASPFSLLADGQDVPLIYDYPPDYPGYLANRHIPVPAVGDISAFAGQTVELDFLTLPPLLRPSDSLFGIDSISFSPELIPEPSTWALLAFGGIALLFRWRFLRCQVRLRRE